MHDLICLYQKILNLPQAFFSRIDHPDAMVATVYLVTQPTKEQLILKICDSTNNFLREVYFLQHFASSKLVPRIIQIIQPEKSTSGAILMECFPGSLLQAHEFKKDLAYEIGCSLARIHLNAMPGYGDPLQHHLYSDPRIYFTKKFEEGLNECKNHLSLDLIKACHNYYQAHVDLLLDVKGPCIVHRDFRPGNIIVQNGQLKGIIDWAGARASFAEEDFCSLEEGNWSKHLQGKKSFLAGYASIRPIPDYKRILALLQLSKAIATIGFMVKRGTWNTSNAQLYRYHRHFLENLLK